MDYVKLLEEILASGYINVIRFFKRAEFTFSQKKDAEKALFKSLKIIESKGGIHAVTAKRLLCNFDNFINTLSAQQYWSSLNVRAEKIATNTAQIILQEKEEQNACQIRSNMLDQNIQLLERKRKDTDDFEEERATKKQDVDMPPFDDKSEADPNDELDFDNNEVFSIEPNIVLTDNNNDDHMVFLNHEEYSEEEISTDKTLDDSSTKWILSSGRDVNEILSKYREKIPRAKEYLYPAYFGILDLSGEDIEVKSLFTDDEWNEMIRDFNNNVNLSDLGDEQERPFYELMDQIAEVLKKKPSDLITGIESCVIKDNIKVNAIRRFIQTYAYNLQRLQLPMSEAAFGSNFTNMTTKGILTFDQTYHYEEGEIQGLASSVITNLKTKPTDRSLIGQKVDFRISKEQFEMLIGLRSGGLPPAAKGKKWMDKVDLAVSLRDVLINEGIENNGIEPNKFHKLFTLGVHTYNYNYNIYGLDWKSKGVWRLGLLQKIKLPTSIDCLPVIEKLIISLLRVEETLHHIRKIHHEILIDKAKLYRARRTSSCAMDYSVCEHGRITRTRRVKE
ncbi:unnamed protein product [Rhizophagus irregularis]|uniref:Uncharacterized protein n=2 Tax=Rhizophagus irregularis TaxID=588596 RepID=A0A916EJU7_9GLOM|nr:unnamed protein product [Rhizophagus irregularis]CAB5393900.1 unnamed protein product [Rhizophagus irregularis]